MRIFLDANIIFSAVRSDGAIRKFLLLLEVQGHELVVDQYVMHEALRNISAKVYPHGEPRWDVLAHVRLSNTFKQNLLNPSIELDHKDRPVLAAAIALDCDVLLTGDRSHFGHLFGTELEGVTIHSPQSLAETLLNDVLEKP